MNTNEPVLPRSPAPEHGPDFWARIDDELRKDDELPKTEELSTTSPGDETVTAISSRSARVSKRSSSRVLAMAAGVFVLVGIGAFALFAGPGDADPATELVVESTAPTDLGGAAAAQVPTAETAESVPIAAAPAPVPTALAVVEGSASQGDSTNDEADSTIDVAIAEGAVLATTPVYLPSDTSSLDAATLLGTWTEQRLSWFNWIDEAESCESHRYSEISYVNEAGLMLPFSDLGRTFSGAVSHFTPSPNNQQVAWLASCESQLELYIAKLLPTPGQVADVRLAWVGEGSTSVAFMLWDGSTVSLNTLGVDGVPFFVDVDVAAQAVTDSSRPVDPGGPDDIGSIVVGATSTGAFTYWNAPAPTPAPSCDGTDNTLWVRNAQGTWLQAVAEVPVSTVVAFDIDSVLSLVAFADACDGANAARVMVGTLRGDGLISSIRVIELGPFAPGSVSELFWVEPNLLRIHTDNSEFGGGVLRYDYVFDEGRDGGILVQLDA